MKIGVLGAGTMGNGIAHVFSLYGNDVILVDIDENILKTAMNSIKSNLKRQLKKKIIDSLTLENTIKNISLSTDIKSFKSCELIIEAVKEDIHLKKDIFKNLDSKEDGYLFESEIFLKKINRNFL